jgi:protein-S-isoprenylcysteine O-methyltransferase Ste14
MSSTHSEQSISMTRRALLPPAFLDAVLALLLLMFARSSLGAAVQGDWGALLLSVQEGCAAILILCRRPLRAGATTCRATLVAWVGALLPLLLRPAPATVGWLFPAGTALQIAGGMLAILATVQLGRSFGIVAANRGIQAGGLYRLVRHPIYAAYVLIFGGFVFAHPSPANVLVLLIWLWAQLGRIQAEEQILGQDDAYRSYQQRVCYRLLPGVW